MTKEQFIKYMSIIHKRYDTLEMLYYDLEKLTGVISDRIINDTSIEPMVDMLAEWVGDTDGWLRWYVFEKEWGNRYELDVTDKGALFVSGGALTVLGISGKKRKEFDAE